MTCTYRCANETHTSLACIQRGHKYSISWHILILSSEVFEFVISSSDLSNICFHQDIRLTVSRQFSELHNNNPSILPVHHILKDHILNIKPASCLLASKHGSQSSCAPSSFFVVLLAKQQSAELKAESVWHPGYIGAAYQGGSM